MGLGSTTSVGKNYLLSYPQSWLLVNVRVGLSLSPAPSFPGSVYEFGVGTLKFISFLSGKTFILGTGYVMLL